MKHNLLKSVIISVILLMGVSNAWAYVTYYLKSNNTTWSTSTYDWGFTHGTTTTTYMDNNGEFKLWRTDWGNDGWFGKGNNTTINLKENGHDGVQLQQWVDGGNVKYVGPSGMVCFHMDQNDGKEASPWVWITRPTFYLKHNWGGGSWTWEALKDNGDGTYTLTAKYGGTGVNYGDDNTSQEGWGYIEDKTPDGNPTTSHNCEFKFNSKDKSLTITRLYTITYNGNGHTGGTVPEAVDKKHGTSITLSSYTPTRTGYTFAGWNTKQNGTGTTYAKSAIYSTNADVTLYAKWTANTYTVTFNKQSGTGGTNSVTATYNATMPSATMPTRTGYTFNGYFDATSGGTKYYNANGTSARTWNKTAATTLYAQWTENKYNVVISTDGNGTTNQTGTKSIGIVGISITATPNIGYAFKQWEVTGGAKVANATSATTIITATAAGTVTANFEKAKTTTVYLKPNAAWKQANARFAVYYWANGDKNAWSDMENIDCNNEYYSAEIPSNCTGFKFVRMNGSTSANNWDNDWNQTIDLKLPTNGKTMFDMNKGKVYLKPNSEWKSDGARFAAYFFSKDGETTTFEKWMSMFDAEDGTYYCEIPEGQPQSVIFCRMDPNNQTNGWDNNSVWNKTVDLQLVDADIFTIENAHFGDGNTGIATGSWNIIWTAPTYDVTLYSSKFGEYGFTLDGQTYTSPESDSIVYQVPIGATVQLFANPHNEAYNDDLMMNQGGTRTEVSANNTSLTINCNTILDDNYKTTSPHVVYLAVPNNGGDWVTNAATEHYAYAFHSRTDLTNDKQEIQMTQVATVYVDKKEHYCYRCEIPAGYNTIRFEKRTSGGVTNIKTVDLNYQIPFNIVNCYRLNGKSGSLFTGVWETLPAITDDYRILYVEQTVLLGEIRFDKSHASDIVKLTNTGDEAIVSLHLYNKRAEGVNGTNNAAVILQRCTGYVEGVAQWEEVEYHMVYDRLHADASVALLPGRRNTVELQDHDGLEVIKAVADNEEHDFGSGVWNFTIRKTDGSATLLLDDEHLKPYEGNYYIRTSNAEGGWINYSIPANHMTFSSYAKKNSDFSHYFCKWVNISEDSPNVKFVVANDYGANISKEFAGDDIIGTNTSDLPANANVRWQWNMVTNEVKRAYIQGSTVQNFLTVTKDNETPTKFRDNGNWIYEADITAKVNEKITAITAPYNTQNQSLLEETYQTGGMPMLTGDGGNTHGYNVRVQYDFKINKTVALLIPGGPEIASAIDVLIERTNQDDATQVSVPITASDTENGYTVYAAMSFTQGHIEGSGTQSEKLYYWVSFPFDVRISDVFGFGEYGVHWIMEYYDGAERAEKGCWADSPTYWRYITDTTSVDIPDNNKNLNCGILKANQGYVLALALNIANMGIFTNTDKVSLYFPSMKPIKEINENIIKTTVTLDEYKCNIKRDNRETYDSNWHIIGVPSFSHKQQTLTQNDLLYFYTRNQEEDTYTPTSAKDEKVTFKSLHSYMVQYAGTINWDATWTLSQPQGLAVKRNVDEEKTHSLRLELSQNGTYNDQTLVTLQEEGATEAFDMNLDLSKMMNAGNNIYTLAGEELIQVAGNALPIANTTIPVGVQIAKAGEYTFAMPDGTAGITVELIDYETNTTTNLLLSEYNVSLPAGTFENRFALIVKPNKVATDMETIDDETNGVKKYIIDGKLFLQKDGMLYDAQGHIVR